MYIILTAIIGRLCSAYLYHYIKYEHDTKAIRRQKLEGLIDVIANYINWNNKLIGEMDARKYNPMLGMVSPAYKVAAIIKVYLPKLRPEIEMFGSASHEFNKLTLKMYGLSEPAKIWKVLIRQARIQSKITYTNVALVVGRGANGGPLVADSLKRWKRNAVK